MDEDEEIQAALQARIAERAELKANERAISAHQSLVKNDGKEEEIKFLSKQERELLEATTVAPPIQPIQPKKPVSILPSKHQQKQQPPAVKPPAPFVKRSTDKRSNKRFKFEWDDKDDTSQDYYYFAPPTDTAMMTTTTTKADSTLLKAVDARMERTQSLYKDVNTKPLDEMTERDWRIVRENFDIHINRTTAEACCHPARNWEEMNLPSSLLRVIQQIGYTAPTPIQMQAVPIGKQMVDMVGQAETGSGKTCAFVLPFLCRLETDFQPLRKNCQQHGPLGLILAPTRELVNQIRTEVDKLSVLMDFPCRTCAVVGGNSAEDQAFLLGEGVDCVIATPGRLIDLLSSRSCVLNQCAFLVLDEADRMLDMGMGAQLDRVLDSLVVARENRTTFMFSATMDANIIRLAHSYMKPSPVVIRIGDEESGGKNKNIDQFVLVLASESHKESALCKILQEETGPVIVFCNAKLNCDSLVRIIKQRCTGKRACALHSGRNQEEREANLLHFKEGGFNVLVATDVAGRGLDVEGVAHVVNYDCPATLDRYCHRIGRTGRAGKRGKATTLVLKNVDDPQVLMQIAKYMKQTGQFVPKELKEAMESFSEGLVEIQE